MPRLALVAALLCLACNDPAGVGDDLMRIRATPTALLLTSESEEPVYYQVFDEVIVPLVDWGPCVVPNQCPSVRRGVSRTVDYSQIAAEREGGGKSARVYYWTLLPRSSGGWEVANFRDVKVPMHGLQVVF